MQSRANEPFSEYWAIYVEATGMGSQSINHVETHAANDS